MDIIDAGQQLADLYMQEALERASQSAHKAHAQLIIWVDRSGGQHEHRLIGTTEDRLDYLKERHIDECPFAFAYYAGGKWFIAGNDAGLRKQLDARTRGTHS